MEKKANAPMKSFAITFDEAVNYIHSFLSEFNLSQIGTNQGIGGIIAKASLEQKEKGLTFYGKMAWFCKNENTENGLPKYFLAFEEGEYNNRAVPESPQNDRLVCSDYGMVFNRNQISKIEVERFLSQFTISTAPIEKWITKDECTRMLTDFGQDKSGNPYNRFYCSFFENSGFVSDEFSHFLKNPEMTYVAYLFGYDDSKEIYIQSNRIRIILMGLSSDGKPLALRQEFLNEPTILQHSWPPPPPNTET